MVRYIYLWKSGIISNSINLFQWMNEKQNAKEDKSQETSSSTGKPVLSFGLDFAIWSASRVLRLYWVVLSIMWNESGVSIWPVSVWCCLMAEKDGEATGKFVRGEIPWCSETLHWNCLMVLPMYWSLQTRHSYLYIIPEQRGYGSFSLCRKMDPMEKVFLNTILRFKCGNRFCVRLVISFLILSDM